MQFIFRLFCRDVLDFVRQYKFIRATKYVAIIQQPHPGWMWLFAYLAAVLVLAFVLAVLLLIIILVLILILVIALVLVLVVHKEPSKKCCCGIAATIVYPIFQALSLSLKIKLTIKPQTTAAVIPPAVAFSPPVNMPRNPFS